MCAFILSFVTYFHDQSGQYSVIGRFSRYRRCRDIEFVRSRVFLYLNGIFYGFACGLYAPSAVSDAAGSEYWAGISGLLLRSL